MKKTTKKVISLVGLSIIISNSTYAANYEVKKDDNFWKIAQETSIPLDLILKANNADEETILYPGQVILLPDSITNTVEKAVTENKKTEVIEENFYGEYLEWFSQVDKLIPIEAKFKVIDIYTKKSYMIQRTIGSYHADCEPLTSEDTEIMKSIWGGFSWSRRPSIVEYNGRRIAASVTFMPHAGVDALEGGAIVDNRSGGYGRGMNFDYVKGNAVDGHIDIHFLGSKRHKDGKVDLEHQKMVKIAAGIK